MKVGDDMELNEKQKKMVEDNHNLIYWYMNKKNIDHDDWYGEIAYLLCKAVIKHDENKGSLSNLFNKYCDWKLYETRHKKKLPMDESIYDEKNALDLVEDKLAFDTDVELRDTIDSECDEREKYVISLLEDGLNQREIAFELGVTQSQVSRIINNIRGKLEDNGYYR